MNCSLDCPSNLNLPNDKQTIHAIGFLLSLSKLTKSPATLQMNLTHFQSTHNWFILKLVHTRNVDLEILLSDAISIEIFPSFQIATAGDSDNV
jgi:hypothetical protein